jgi:hypothetical protein
VFRRSKRSANKVADALDTEACGWPRCTATKASQRERLAQTPSLEEIAVRARERLLELVFVRLCEAASSPRTLPAA